MFKMRPEHREAFRRAAMEDFEERAIAHLKKGICRDAVATRSDEQLRQQIRRCLARAARYGLTSEFEVSCFIDAALLLGDDFDSNPRHVAAQMVLRSPSLGPQEKAESLLKFAMVLSASLAADLRA